jgi:hypothetical protein
MTRIDLSSAAMPKRSESVVDPNEAADVPDTAMSGPAMIAGRADRRDPFYRENVVSSGDAKITRGNAIEVLKYFNNPENKGQRTATLNGMYYTLVKGYDGERYLAVTGKQWDGFLPFYSQVQGVISLTNELLGGLDKRPPARLNFE